MKTYKNEILSDQELIKGFAESLSSICSSLVTISLACSAPYPPAPQMLKFVFGTPMSKDEQKTNIDVVKITVKLLRNYGIHENHKGYPYIIDSVWLILKMGAFDVKLSKDVFPRVASSHNVQDIRNIEHNIRNAISAACRDDLNKSNTNFMYKFGRKPTTKEFLFLIAEQVNYELYQKALG